MDTTNKLDILFILNPISGGKKKVDWPALIKKYFSGRSEQIKTLELTGKNDAIVIRRLIKDLGPQKVVAVGGDGTINLVAKELLNTLIPLGILRGGSANGMATELKIPTDPVEAMDVIIKGSTTECDAIKINKNDISIHLSDLGLNARLVKYYEKSSIRGMWSYAKLLLKILIEGRLMLASIKTGEMEMKVAAYMIVLANASKYGTGAVINPEGLVHDGKFELVVVRRISIIALIKMFLSKKPFDPQKVEIFEATDAEITVKRSVHFQVDGEYKGKLKKINASIVPSALHIIIKG